MKNVKIICNVSILSLLFVLLSCGSSNVNGGSGNGQDVAFDPTTTSNLEVVGYNVLMNRLLVDFGLDDDSDAVDMLEDQKGIFDLPDPTYTSLFSVSYTKIMALACEEMSNDALFPEGAKIDTAWKALTGKTAYQSANDIEADILAETSSSSEDIKIFSLCMAVALDAQTVFINFVANE